MASKLHHGLQRETIAKSMSIEDSVIAGKNGKKIVHDWLGNGKTFSGEQTTFLAFHLQRCQICTYRSVGPLVRHKMVLRHLERFHISEW